MSWRIIRGPREFDQLESFDMDVGWGYTLERDGEEHTISVIVAGGRAKSAELPDDARQAVSTRSHSAVQAVLANDAPPRYLIVGTTGVQPREPER